MHIWAMDVILCAYAACVRRAPYTAPHRDVCGVTTPRTPPTFCFLTFFDVVDVVVVVVAPSTAPWRPAALAVGLMLLALAPVVANSAVFHYTLGVVVAVLLVLVYLWRNPRKTVSAAVLFSAIGVMRPALARDFGFAATWGLPAAAAVAGVVGIIVVYIMRPTQNERFCNVVQWTLQLIAIAVIVLCSTSEPIGRPIVAGATAAVLVFLLLFGQYLPFVSLAWTPFALCRRLFWGLKKRK